MFVALYGLQLTLILSITVVLHGRGYHLRTCSEVIGLLFKESFSYFMVEIPDTSRKYVLN